ncbi:MAG: PASTA domain-containing protein [Sphingobacteriales bacterium]|nr:MAG: PASTA domain-containing protein [Sphingobacteriales bacterium]
MLQAARWSWSKRGQGSEHVRTALLSDGLINVESAVNCEGGAKQFANRVMHDSHHGLGVMPIKNAFAQSSNVAMASLAQRFYGSEPEKFIAHLKRLHLTKRTGIDLAGERRPAVIEPGTQHWSATTLPWLATGYNILVSPLHTCMLYNAVANNGKMMKPYLVSAVREYGKDVKSFGPKVLVEKIASDEAVKQLRACVEEVAITGTGKHIASPYYKVAGKTGTAQVADKGIRYTDRVYQGSFVGYFPADNPRYTIAVVIRTKANSNAYYGGTLAAPVFRMIADKIFASGLGDWDDPLDSIARKSKVGLTARYAASARNYQQMLNALDRTAAMEVSDKTIGSMEIDTNKRATVKPAAVYHGIVPDVKGLGLKDAIYILENEGLKVSVQGRGTVKGQSLAPGARISKGQIIILQLS